MSLSQDIFISDPLQGGTANFRDAATRNDYIDTLAAKAAAAGWTLVEGIYATIDLNIMSMVSGSGYYSQIALIDGYAFEMFDSSIGQLDPTGTLNYQWPGGPYPSVGIDGAGSYADRIAYFANEIGLKTTWNSQVLTPIAPYDGRIRITYQVAGSAGNLQQVIGSGHTVSTNYVQGGGWKYRSAPANGISSFDLAWYLDGFGYFALLPTLNGNERGALYPLQLLDRYMVSLGPYHLAIVAQQNSGPADLGDNAGERGGGRAFYICAPYVPSEHALTYGAFAFPLNQTSLEDKAGAQVAINGAYFYGHFDDTGETGFAFFSLYGYEETDLFLVNGQPILLTPWAGAGLTASAQRRIMGATWDSFITPVLYPLETVVMVDDRQYIAIARTTDGQRATWFLRFPNTFHLQGL